MRHVLASTHLTARGDPDPIVTHGSQIGPDAPAVPFGASQGALYRIILTPGCPRTRGSLASGGGSPETRGPLSAR